MEDFGTGPCSACQIIDAIGQSENSHLLPQNFPGNLDSDIFTYPNAGDIGSIDHFLLDFETQDVGFQYQPFHTGEAAMTNDEHSGLVPTCFDDTPLANAHSDGSIQTAQSLEAGDSDSYGLTTNPYMSSFEYGVAHTTQECTNSTPIPDSLSTSSLTIDGHHQGHRRNEHEENVAAHSCTICGDVFDDYGLLASHAWSMGHSTFKCSLQPCSFTYDIRGLRYLDHLSTVHPNMYTCNECDESFGSQEDLGQHAGEEGHAALICNQPDCGRAFSRLDIYKRHQLSHDEDAKRYPCKYCKKYRGNKGFKRKDHLTQHLRGYHHIGEDDVKSEFSKKFCTVQDCPDTRGDRKRDEAPFKKTSDYTKHMKSVHNQSKFPCPETGCDRVGAKGYSRKTDLWKHLKKVHGNSGNVADEEE